MHSYTLVIVKIVTIIVDNLHVKKPGSSTASHVTGSKLMTCQQSSCDSPVSPLSKTVK